MDVLVERCAGLDVHRDSVVATVRVPGRRRGTRRGETRTFATTIAGLTRMADWLVGEHAVTLVGMEATGVYWKPVFAVLEPEFGVECWLLNAQHMHNVPGRKTDVADSPQSVRPSCCLTVGLGFVGGLAGPVGSHVAVRHLVGAAPVGGTQHDR